MKLNPFHGFGKLSLTARVLGSLVLAIVLLGLFIAAVYWTQFYIPAQRLEAQLDAIRDRGEPVTLSELDEWYEHLPDEENAAIPVLKVIEEFAWDDPELNYYAHNYERKSDPDQPLVTENELQMIEETSELLDSLIELELGTSRWRGARYPLDMKEGMSVALPHLPGVRSIVCLACMRAEAACLTGDWEGLVENIQLARDVTDTLSGEPVLISQLVNVACEHIVLYSIEQVCNEKKLPPTILEALRDMFRNRTPRVDLRNAVVGERAMELAGLVQTYGGLGGAGTANFEGTFIERNPWGWVTRWLYPHDTGFAVNFVTEIIESTRTRWPEFIAFTFANQKTSDTPGMMEPMTSIIYPSTVRIPIAFIRLETAFRTLDTGLAIELFYHQFERLPNTLDEMVGTTLETVPRDPFSGDALLYKQLEGGFAVYSVGKDLDDDSETWLDEPSLQEKSGDIFFLVRRPELAQP